MVACGCGARVLLSDGSLFTVHIISTKNDSTSCAAILTLHVNTRTGNGKNKIRKEEIGDKTTEGDVTDYIGLILK